MRGSYVAFNRLEAYKSWERDDGWSHKRLRHTRSKNQPQLARMSHQDPRRQRLQQVVEVAIPTTGLVADLEPIGQSLEDLHHLRDASHAGAMGHLSRLSQGADRNMLRVNVQSDVKHDAPPSQKT